MKGWLHFMESDKWLFHRTIQCKVKILSWSDKLTNNAKGKFALEDWKTCNNQCIWHVLKYL